MVIHQRPRGGQFSIHGNFAHVSTDVNTTIKSLPRSFDDAETIPLKLKRKLCYNKDYQFETVRPRKVLRAVKYLVENSSLFKEEEIHISDRYMEDNAGRLSHRKMFHI